MRRSLAFFAVLSLLLHRSPASAEEVRVSLDECLTQAMRTALEIRTGQLGPPIARTYVSEAASEFDHLFSFRTSGGFAVRQSGTFFGGADEIREQSFDGQVGLERKTRTGGSYLFGFQTNDLVTNSVFFNFRPQWTNALTFRFTQPLLRTGWKRYNVARTRLAESGVRGATAGYRAVLETTLAAVERSYWNLVFLRENLEVRRHSARVARELLRVGTQRLQAGAGTRIEVVQAEAGVADREKELIAAEHLLKDAQDALRSYLHPFPIEPEREIEFIPTDRVAAPAALVPEDVPDRLRRAFGARPDLLALREDLAAAGIRLVQAESELLPRLDFFGSVGLSGLDDNFHDSSRTVLRSDFVGWEIGLSFEIPLGNRGARARHRRTLLERARTVAGFESLKNRVVVEVRGAIRAIETSYRETLAARKATAAAEAQFDAEKDRLQAEKSTNYQLLQVEEDLSRARSQELGSIVAYRISLVNLEIATGTYCESRGLTTPADRPEEEEKPGPPPEDPR